jgi:hypothetical protein
LQQANQSIQMRSQQVLAAEMQHDALADFTALAIILDQAEVSVIAGFGLAKEHRSSQNTPRLFQCRAGESIKQ